MVISILLHRFCISLFSAACLCLNCSNSSCAAPISDISMSAYGFPLKASSIISWRLSISALTLNLNSYFFAANSLAKSPSFIASSIASLTFASIFTSISDISFTASIFFISVSKNSVSISLVSMLNKASCNSSISCKQDLACGIFIDWSKSSNCFLAASNALVMFCIVSPFANSSAQSA